MSMNEPEPMQVSTRRICIDQYYYYILEMLLMFFSKLLSVYLVSDKEI